MKSEACGATDSTEPAPSTSPTLVADSEKATSGDEAMQVDDKAEEKQSKVLSNVEVLCKHNMLDPLKVTQVKRVSQLGVMSLRDLGVTMEPELLIRKDFCRECVWSIAAGESGLARVEEWARR